MTVGNLLSSLVRSGDSSLLTDSEKVGLSYLMAMLNPDEKLEKSRLSSSMSIY